MFQKILIANRGEIACRVIDTARRMGIATVAVYSDADSNARHRALADEAVHIGPAPAAESYLKGERIIEAALATGAQAIHPGYGFLSENPGFVEAVEAAGLVFIGPSPASIRAMGLKDAAKALMIEAGVPVVPGYHGERQDADFLAAEADKIGYPVLIKARAGGGGKGMRLVEKPADFAAALEGAQREGRASFGDGAVLIERYVTSPRHIEVQVFGDRFGTVVHLYERDCSLQRRHQKVIEEAPAPGMTAELRAAMTAAAVKAAKAVSYHNAGTIEFIVDGSGPLRPDGFWFMEMNTRLQVEHPVTEAITGLDLVEWQLRVAAGEPLPLTQDEIPLNGHAFEARLYAEDPGKGFLPAPGPLLHVAFPETARIDTGVRAGDRISAHYDPMIAKLTAQGPSRADALFRLRRALAATHVAGTATNLSLLQALCRDTDFAVGKMDTGLIGRKQEALTAAAPPDDAAILFAAMTALDLDPARPQFGFRLWGTGTVRVEFVSGDDLVARDLRLLGAGQIAVEDGGCSTVFEAVAVGPDGLRARQGGRNLDAKVAHVGDAVSLLLDGRISDFALIDPLAVEHTGGAAENRIVAPMTGVVRSVPVTAGSTVAKGDILVVMEAMKMEHSLRAAADGVVEAVHCTVGDTVDDGTLLVDFAPQAAEGAPVEDSLV
ncbi:acetyl/propionyl/methylcrotonyl-CoA carboxylase subunit alpha [Zavarzinia compransoris]|uniref:3-methylcrotonyl-CoA carboxylase n=1 Tax=Zavarzinia compransoris TaxID=1264899 RepID=A0A317E4R1_9PROT|nr:acetyl/propionyl/methylcrotonyl-CoA carboxylase subunit alpha [Zavarzinia compransoris]PWR21562.1 3-methylcrotonyl-CoA carboxylase [Zavarzinia compransoris]TDP45663.1 3-methylcrotonoyl-CoA carboxylase alpha subunit [Zavarzinia compransoris]